MSFEIRNMFAKGLKLPIFYTKSDKERLRKEHQQKQRIKQARQNRARKYGLTIM